MTLVHASAISHAPGFIAWVDAAPPAQKDALYAGAETLRRDLAAAQVDELILFTSEHWTNFFYDHVSPFCVGRADKYEGPVEPWLKIGKKTVPGSPDLAEEILAAAYAQDLTPGFAQELAFDHGTMIPLSFLTPDMDLPVVPIIINTLVAPQPSPKSCYALGKVVGEVARRRGKRVAIVATGGMSHDPGERNHGFIDEDFDHRFLDLMAAGDVDALQALTVEQLGAAGAGAIELLGWIALAGALSHFTGEVVAYQAVVPWATGMGLMRFNFSDGLDPR